VEAWVAKGTAWRFEHVGKPASLVELTADALAMCPSTTRAHWLARVDGITEELISDLVHALPVLSDPARSFAIEVLKINRRRLLDECR
jgi:hypothetical protein